MANGGVIENGVKLIGEMVIPGASLLLDGDIKAGTGHAVAGIAAWALLGPARLLVSANSFSKSVTNENLHTHLLDMFKTTKSAVNNGIAGVRRRQSSVVDTTVTDTTAEAAAAPA